MYLPLISLNIRPDEEHVGLYDTLQTVRLRVAQVADLSSTIGEIRTWLDHRKIQSRSFRTKAGLQGYLLTIDFRGEDTAELFRQQFQRPVPTRQSDMRTVPSPIKMPGCHPGIGK